MTVDFLTALREAGLRLLCAHYSLPASAFDPTTVRLSFRGVAGEDVDYSDGDPATVLTVRARLQEEVLVTRAIDGEELSTPYTCGAGRLLALDAAGWQGRSLEELLQAA